MEMNYTLIKFKHRDEEAYAANDVTVSYKYDESTVVDSNLSLEDAKESLDKIKTQVAILSTLLREFHELKVKNPTDDGYWKAEEKWFELQSKKYDNHPGLQNITWSGYSFAEDITKMIANVEGNYLILPCIHEEVLA